MNSTVFRYLILTLISLFWYETKLLSQEIEHLKVIYYNVLNFPNPSNNNSLGKDSIRHVYFRNIIEAQDADIIVMQEVKELFGIQNLVAELNSNGSLGKTYAHSNDLYRYGALGNMIIYNDDRINLVSHTEVPRTNTQSSSGGNSFIAPRANSRFIVDIFSIACPSEHLRLELYSGHFKGSNDGESSTTISDRDRRNLAALDLMAFIDTIPISRNIIMGGDFNFYADNVNDGSFSEPGYVTLTNSSYNHQFTDPLDGWIRNSSTQVEKYTQSTRLSLSEFGNGGSSGGLDDRFDFIVFNQAIDQGTNEVTYVENSFGTIASSYLLNSEALDGSHPLKEQVHKMSDHYPVELELELTFSSCNLICDGVVLNEIHYNNNSTDINEFIEVAVPVNAGLDASDYAVTLYNGNGGMSYDTESLDNFVLGISDANYDYYTWNPVSIQNGNPDGFSISKKGGHCEFLSYGGLFIANDGPAVGINSSEILVSENDLTPEGVSLQLIDGNWVGPSLQTFGTTNINATPCVISNINVINTRCDGTSLLFDVTFDSNTISGNFEVIDLTNGEVVIGSSTSNVIVVSLINNTDETPFIITVRNADETTCIGNQVSVQPIDCSLSCGDVFINEIAYENTGGDLNEFIEVAVSTATSIELFDYTISLYNGNGGGVYDSEKLSEFTIGNSDAQYTYYTWYPSSIQNGSPDGVALSTSTLLCELLSYEGSLTATSGPAAGMSSVNIGVSEPTGDPVGNSLQLLNNVWLGAISETPGSTNVDPNCVLQFTLSGTESGIADYETSGTITSTQIIMGTAKVDYDAETDITLEFPFEVNSGAVFEAFSDGCNNGAGGVN